MGKRKWDRDLSHDALVFMDDFTVKRPRDRGIAPRAMLTVDETQAAHFAVRVVALPPSNKFVTIGLIQKEQGSDREINTGDLSSRTNGLCISHNCSKTILVALKHIVKQTDALREGDVVTLEWKPPRTARLILNGSTLACSLEAPVFLVAQLADETVVRLESTWVDVPERVYYAEQLLADTDFTDAKILCSDGQTVGVHRAMLAAVSPVFRAMFQSSMREAQERRVKILAPRVVVEDLLQHIYTGKFDQNIDAGATVELAHMYGLEKLEAFCYEVMVAKVDAATVSNYALKIGRLSRASGDQPDSPAKKAWKCFCDTVSSNPRLVQALLESHIDMST